ncbi:hypothetical protein NHX12_008458 [Muraenolepis orangiensis]|uniref:Nudix hydrolase domain-containing protein n=1 Tax=Muraenolepis orangiensis TaxID=630683 RepID=A0A9Q0DPY7_9TELE|nr:hypothetical protein NHX12_008458 [Muraenolepis orangiensis]
MLKGPHIWAYALRSLRVGVRDPFYWASPLASPENICRRWWTSTGCKTLTTSQNRGRVKEGDVSFSTETPSSVSAPALSSSGRGHYLLEAAKHQNVTIRAALSVRPKLPSPTQPKITLEYLTQTSESLYACGDSSNNVECLGPQSELQPISPPPACLSPGLHRPGLFPPQARGSATYGPAAAAPARWNLQSRALHRAAPRQPTAPRDCLSPENEQRCRRSLGRHLKLYEARGKDQGGWASILVSLCSVRGEPSFLFTLRSSQLKRNKGDVSFAGGKKDPSDKDVVHTALREAREELGVTVATEKVWGILKPLRDMSGMMVAPVLANLGPIEDLSFKPNSEEVEEVFTMSLSHACDPSNRGYTHFRTGAAFGYTLPVFRNGKHRVWGLTAVALDHTLALILSP